jgi:signal transduction histidine kinase/ActR/RegA family two-component response regulator
MPGSKDSIGRFEALRKQAEKLIERQADTADDRPADVLDLIHDLKIHQAELEIQNEELKRAQHEISELQREYQDLYEFAPFGYLTLNRKGIIERMNLTATRLLDTSRNHESKVGFSQLIASGWEGTFISARAKSAETGEKQSIELPVKRKNEPPLWLRMEIEADRDDAEAVIQWRVVLLDISEKKKALEALECSEAKYRKMMESITDSVYVCSPESTIEYMNPAMVKWLGRDAVGETCHKAIHGTDESCEWCPFEKVRNGETIEEKIKCPVDNHTYRTTHMPVLNDDHTVSKLTIYRDITDYLAAVAEMEKAQAELQRARKMETIGTLAGGIAHEFNNILSIILGNNEMIMKKLPEGSQEKENAGDIHAAVLRARDVVNQLLLFSRQTDEKKKPIQIGTVIKESLKLIRSTIPANIDINQKIADDVAPIFGNATQINQLLINLCGNAVDAMIDTGGTITIVLNNESHGGRGLNSSDSGRYVKLMVCDSGHGMDQHTLDRIFDPYFTTKDIGKGTGIGLAVVDGIVKEHNGVISAESSPDKGAEFTILLPAYEDHIEQEIEQEIDMPKGHERILLVDDEPAMCKLGKLRLEELGYEVQGSTDPFEVLKIFKKDPEAFDLIITDMAMPRITGAQLSVEILKTRPSIPILLCTGYSEIMSEEKAREIGVSSFFIKPIDEVDFAVIVRKTLDEANGAAPE